MKKVFKKGLVVIAVVAGMTTAFAFTAPKKSNSSMTTGNYYVLEDGETAGDPVILPNRCSGTGNLCSQEYEEINGELVPTGGNQVFGVKN